MKKFISYLLILIMMAVMLPGCGGSDENAETEGEAPSQSAESIESAEGAENEKNTEVAGAEGLGSRLSASYADMMENGEYLMKYRATMEYEGQDMEFEATVAVSGGNMAVSSRVAETESVMISKDGENYIVDHDNKMIFSVPQDAWEEGGTINVEGITYVGAGEEAGLVYEEYSTFDGSVRYYFDGDDLVKITGVVDGETVQMDILEMSSEIPAGIFDIPADYQQFKM